MEDVESGSKVSIFLRIGGHWTCDCQRGQRDEPEGMLKQGPFSSLSLSWVTLSFKGGHGHFKITVEKMEGRAGNQKSRVLCFELPSTFHLVYK